MCPRRCACLIQTESSFGQPGRFVGDDGEDEVPRGWLGVAEACGEETAVVVLVVVHSSCRMVRRLSVSFENR